MHPTVARLLKCADERGIGPTSLLYTQLQVSPATFTNWKSRGVSKEGALRAQQVLGCSAHWILTGQGSPFPFDDVEYAGQPGAAKRIPVVGTAKLGSDGYFEEFSEMPGSGDGFIEIATEDANAYCLRVRGQSMYPAIRDGWYVLIEPNGTPREGEYVLIRLRDGRKMVKEFLFRRATTIELMSVNGGERISFGYEDLDEGRGMQAVGAVVSPSKWRPL